MLACYRNLGYNRSMPVQELTLGEYIRRLRREKKWNLQTVAERSGLAYTHLSRIENDSTVPGPGTVAKLAEALDGDLKLMLEMADCLPRQILDRLMSREQVTAQSPLRRAAGARHGQAAALDPATQATALARAAGISESDVPEVAETLVGFLQLDRARQRALGQLIKTFMTGDDGPQR